MLSSSYYADFGFKASELRAADEAADRDLSNDVATAVCLSCITCEQLAKQLERNKREQVDADLAAATYDPNALLPEGYRRATPQELESMGLVDGDFNMLQLDDHPDFHADVFIGPDPTTGLQRSVVGFRGTTNWGTQFGQNVGQALGGDPAYYRQARAIGQTLGKTNQSASFVGHSLGGGLASTASGAAGMPAQTFNAAGLHENTLRRLFFDDQALVNSTNVMGDFLSDLQDGTFLPNAFGDRRAILPQNSPQESLHSIGEVQDALDSEEADIKKQQKDKGCPT